MAEANLVELCASHIAEYSSSLRLCVRKLIQTHCHVGLSQDEQSASFVRASALALAVWTEACESADADRHALNEKVRFT